MRRINFLMMSALAIVMVFLGQSTPMALASSGTGAHGGKMALCFFDVQVGPDGKPKVDHDRKPILDLSSPDKGARDKYFIGSGSKWQFKDDEARAAAKGHFTATLLELSNLKDADELNNVWAKNKNGDPKTFDEALLAMHDEFKSVPKFYRLLEAQHPASLPHNYSKFPIIGDDDPMLETGRLPPVDDAGENTIPPDNCVPVQAAMRQGPKIDYDPLIWEAASPVQRAALQLHEEVYSLGALYFGHQDSRQTQDVILYLAQGKIRPAWSVRPCVVQGFSQTQAECARQDYLSSLLSETGSDAESLGYYPPLYSLNALRGALIQNIGALDGALQTVGAYCEATRGNDDLSKSLGRVHASLSGLVKRFNELAKFGNDISQLIASQNDTIELNADKTKKESSACRHGSYCIAELRDGEELRNILDHDLDNEDPEVTLATVDRLLQTTVSHVSREMASQDPNRLFTSRHGFQKRGNGAENYCAARKGVEEDLARASQLLDQLDFLRDSTLPESAKTFP